MVQDCPEAPHKAIIWLRGEIFEVLKTGECSGRPLNTQHHTIQINAKSREEAASQLLDAMEKLKLCVPNESKK